jgi:hypothetical protein
MFCNPRVHFTLLFCLLFSSVPSQGQDFSDEANIDYVLTRYVDAMGGRAALQKLISMRLTGTITDQRGQKQALVVLKKKPNFVRLTLEAGNIRFVQAYNGKVAWTSRESGDRFQCVAMTGETAGGFIREAPITNALVDRNRPGVKLEMAEEVTIVGIPCYQVIVSHEDGSSMAHYISKESFLEHRIVQRNAEGEIVSELVPSKFELMNGVTFAMRTQRIVDGKPASTIDIEAVDINFGLLNTAFNPPVTLETPAEEN